MEADLQEAKIKTSKVLDAVDCIKQKRKAMAINVNSARKQSKAGLPKFPRNPSGDSCFLAPHTPAVNFKFEDSYCAEEDVNDASGSLCTETLESMSAGNEEFMPHMEMQQQVEADSEVNERSEEKNRSLCSDMWARKHFVEWRKEQGFANCQIEELPLSEVSECLVKFFYMVKKRNGNLFPSESLRSMFRAFGRILRAHYKKLQAEGKYDGPVVDLSRDPLFEKSRLACLEAIKYSKVHGANVKRRKKPDEWIPAPEEDILCHPANQVTDPYGLLKRLCFYIIHKFHVYGHMELYYTTDMEFQRFLSDDGTPWWEYDEKRTANHKRKSSFREAVRCSESDVVLCLDKYFFHAPPKANPEEPRQLFLAPIGKPDSNIWYRNQIMNLKTLRGWYRYMGPMPGRAESDQQSSLSRIDSGVYTNLGVPSTAAGFLQTHKAFNEEVYDGYDATDLTDDTSL